MDVVTYALSVKHAKEYTDTIAEKLAGGLRYMGSVNTQEDLPEATVERKGHLYTVVYELTSEGTLVDLGHEFVCDGNSEGASWIDLGEDIGKLRKELKTEISARKKADSEETARAIGVEATKVDRPNEPVAGQGVNVPYYFDVNYAADNVTVKDYTVDLLNKDKAFGEYSLNVNPATNTLAGVMKASDAVAVRETLPTKIDTEIDDRKQADSEEAAFRIASDNALTVALTSEAQTRLNNDNQLQTNIDTEALARQDADNALDIRIDSEIADRKSADITLQNNITSEEHRAIAKETELQTNIDKKVDRLVEYSDNKSYVSNTIGDGGSCLKFEHNDGTWSAVAVNDGGAHGIAAQIYAINGSNYAEGTKINVEKSMITYIKNKATSERDANDEIAVIGDVNKKQDKLTAGNNITITVTSSETIISSDDNKYTVTIDL